MQRPGIISIGFQKSYHARMTSYIMTSYFLVTSLMEVECDGGGQGEGHHSLTMFDYVIGVFIVFVVFKILQHCYLKRQARRLTDGNSMDHSIDTMSIS